MKDFDGVNSGQDGLGEVRTSNTDDNDQPHQQQAQLSAQAVKTLQRRLEPKDNIFAQPKARKESQPSSSNDDDDEKLCSTNTERKNRTACIEKECSGDRTSLCAKRCRYVHCVSSPAEREGNGCNTVEELTCKVDCFVKEKCDGKKNQDKVEDCRRDCRQECCNDSESNDEESKNEDENDDDKPDKEEQKKNGDMDGEGKEENGMAGSRGGAESEVGSDEPAASAGTATSEIGPKPNAAASQGNDGIVQGAGAIAVVVDDEGTGDAIADDGGGEDDQPHEDEGDHHEDNDQHDDDPPPSAPAPDPAIAIGGDDANGDNDIEQRDGEYTPVDFVFNLPVADEGITAEDILTGANGNTVLEDVEGGLALLLPDLVEDTFGGSGGDERMRRCRMLRNYRKMLVEYDDTEPPKITNVFSAVCATMTDHHNDGHEDHTSDHHADDENGHQNCFDFEARTVLYVEDKYLPSVRERFTAATMEAVVDGKLESAISQYNPSYGDGTISEMRGTVPMDQQQESVWTTGVIAGVASAAGVVLLLALYFIWRRCHGRKKSGNADGVASNSTGSSDGNGSDDENAKPDPVHDEDNADDDEKPPSPRPKPAAKARDKNICAAPMEIDPNFVPPVHPKSSEDGMLIRQALGCNFVFDNLSPDELKTMVRAFEKHSVPSGSDIITQGDMGDYFYVIHSGTVDFIVNDSNVGHAGTGKSFGELALLYNAPRAATCRAAEDCEVWRVDQKTFRIIMASTAVSGKKGVRDILLKISFLKEITPMDLSRVIDALSEVKFKPGEDIFLRGDEGDAFYVVKEGKVKIHDILVGNTRYDDVFLCSGDYFGERALLTAETRAASVTAMEDTTCLSLSREEFTKLLGDVTKLILKAADKRKLRALPIFEKARVREFELDAMAGQLVDMSFDKGGELSSIGMEVDPCIVFVREGKLEVKAEDGSASILSEGGYFGDETISSENYGYMVHSMHDITALEDTTVGVLTLDDIANILGSIERLDGKCNLLNSSLKLDDIEKHRILGVGTFGQVWLASVKSARADKEVYALKVQVKRELLNHQQVDGVMREKEVMTNIDHPFIIKLVSTFQDKRNLYMLLQLVQGGELFSILHSGSRDGISENGTMFYSAGILEGLSHMHRRNILYRDLKPENVLIDSSGYPVIVDLGFAKIVEDKTFTLCGTTIYIAPELILSRGHDKAADYWSLGVLIYEMIIGKTPFVEDGLNQMALFKKICKGTFSYPRPKMGVTVGQPSSDLKDLIDKLLVVRAAHRLGSLAGADKDIRAHPWYSRLDWNNLVKKGYTAPWIPKLKDAMDSSCFDNWDHMSKEDQPQGNEPSADEQRRFEGF